MSDGQTWPNDNDTAGQWAVPGGPPAGAQDRPEPHREQSSHPYQAEPTWPSLTASQGYGQDAREHMSFDQAGPPPYVPLQYGASPHGGSPYGPPGYGYAGPHGSTPYGQPLPGPAQSYGAFSDHRVGQPARPQRERGLRSAAAVLVLAAAVIAGAGLSHVVWPTGQLRAASGGSSSSGASGGSPANPTPSTTPGSSGGPGSTPEGSGGPSDVAAIAAEVDPAVVDINVTFNYAGAEGAGTGIVITSDGEVLTNNHVIDQATKISVTDVGDGKTYPATVVGYDSTHDVAVLQLQGASGLATAKLATGSSSFGEAVVAIGNAGGAGGTPTSAGGSVTALDQTIIASDALTQTQEHLTGLIEVNANIESGDSGGPLVNTAGQVMGMDTAASSSFAFSAQGNQGFAIPIAYALGIAKSVEAGRGTSAVHVGGTAFIGVVFFGSGSAQAPSGSNAAASELEVGEVVGGAPAEQAGITAGDTITGFAGTALTSPEQLTHLLVGHHPGDKVALSWTDSSGQSHTATVTLASGPPA